jgi:hypothetical protein
MADDNRVGSRPPSRLGSAQATKARRKGVDTVISPAPPTLRFPERTGVALRSDLAHDNHQNSNFYFACASPATTAASLSSISIQPSI